MVGEELDLEKLALGLWMLNYFIWEDRAENLNRCCDLSPDYSSLKNSLGILLFEVICVSGRSVNSFAQVST